MLLPGMVGKSSLLLHRRKMPRCPQPDPDADAHTYTDALSDTGPNFIHTGYHGSDSPDRFHSPSGQPKYGQPVVEGVYRSRLTRGGLQYIPGCKQR